MNKAVFFIVSVIVFSLGCKEEETIPEDTPDYCSLAFEKLSSESFSGTIYLCNAQPPEMDFLDASANVSAIDSNQISIHLKSEIELIDTILNFDINCLVVEKNSPLIFIRDNQGNELGQYNQDPDRISFGFGYENCLNNTHFEGFAD